jgi:hypothetical protein
LGGGGTGSEVVAVATTAAQAITAASITAEFNRYIGDPLNWPEQLRDAVRQHGPKRVWDAGIRVMSYPPTWITESTKAARVLEELKV